MSPLLGHVLAQMVSLGVGDRTEGRYIDANYGRFYEAATVVRAELNLNWKHTEVSLGYAPSFTVTPLDLPRRELLVYHIAGVAGTYRWQHTAVTASESVGVGQLNFITQGLGDARAQATATNTPGATPAAGTPTAQSPANGNPGAGTSATSNQANQIRALNQVVTYVNSVSALSVAQNLTPVLSLAASVGYQVSGGIGSSESATYPIVQGPLAQVATDYLFTRQDVANSLLSVRYASVRDSNNSWIFSALESWKHSFSVRTTSRVGAGLSMTRTAQPDGLIAWSIYPTFTSAFNHVVSIDRSLLALSLTASSSPALDPVRATVDPRLSLGAGARWSLEDFYSALVASTELSLADASHKGSLSSAAGSFGVGYRLGKAMSVDSGVRAFWQNYEGAAVVPLTLAAFVGVTVSAATTPR